MRRPLTPLLGLVVIAGCNLIPSSSGGGHARRIKVGTSASGALTDSGPRMRGNRGPYEVWTLRGRRGERLVIDITSSAFDTYVYLRDSDGFLIAQDDDGGGNRNARVRTILPRNGAYRIIATSFGATASGDYNLSVAEWPAPAAPGAGRAQQIAVGETKDGLLEPGDEFSGDGPYQDRWTYEVPAGQRVRLDMQSTDVDSYLIVLGPDGQVVGTNDDANGRDASIVVHSAAAGRYTALATTYGDAPRVGAYRLKLTTVTGDFAEPGVPQEITDGQTRDGQLETGDSTTVSGTFVDVYTFRAPRAGTAVVDLVSTDLDPYLTVQDANGMTLATDDDSGEGMNAQLPLAVTAGTQYRMLAGTYGTMARNGSYRLTVRMNP